jgi:DNA-directed RNA polymerase specialized sigma24 family protein
MNTARDVATDFTHVVATATPGATIGADTMYRRYRRVVTVFARVTLGSRHQEADDVAQDVWERLTEAGSLVEPTLEELAALVDEVAANRRWTSPPSPVGT